MKIVLCLVFLISLSLTNNFDPDYDYEKYMRQFQRNYKGQEKIKHQKKFKENLKEIQRLLNQGYDVEVNEFTDWDELQLSNFLNYRPEQIQTTRNPKPLKSSLSASLPNPLEFDWRAQDRVTDVRNQGNCGSCWAFAAAALFESQLAIQQAGKKYNISQQYLLQCEKYSSGCNGGSPFNAILLAKQTGIPSQQAFPYTRNSSSYNPSQICSPSQTIQLSTPIYDIDYRKNISISQLQQLLVTNGPIVVGVDASNMQFLSSRSLIYCSTPVSINHAILLVGYNSSHWYIKNSWGVNWADQGYAYIDKTNDCLLRQAVIIVYPPSQASSSADSVNLTINMSDSYGDGWEGSIVAVRQNGVIVDTFGANYTFGRTKGPFYMQIAANIQTQVVLYQIGNFTKQIGFTLSTPSQPNLYTLTPGLSIPSNTIFVTFCPDPKLCSISSTVTYYLTLNDSYGDGWNGNVLGFRANGVILQNFTIVNGRSLGPIAVSFDKYVKVQIVVVVLGNWTDQTGFDLRNKDGFIVARKANTLRFSANSILGTFYPQSTNLSPVLLAPPAQFLSDQQKAKYSQTQSSLSVSSTLLNDLPQQLSAYQITTYVLASICLIFIMTTIVLAYKLHRVTGAQANIISKIDHINTRKPNDDPLISCSNILQKGKVNQSDNHYKSKCSESEKSDSYGSSKNII